MPKAPRQPQSLPPGWQGEGELGRRIPSELRVGRALPASIQARRGLGQRQRSFGEPAIEAFDEGILHGFAGRDVVLCDAASIRQDHDGVGGELAAIVADHHSRPAAFAHQPVQSRATLMKRRYLLSPGREFTSGGHPGVREP